MLMKFYRMVVSNLMMIFLSPQFHCGSGSITEVNWVDGRNIDGTEPEFCSSLADDGGFSDQTELNSDSIAIRGEIYLCRCSDNGCRICCNQPKRQSRGPAGVGDGSSAKNVCTCIRMITVKLCIVTDHYWGNCFFYILFSYLLLLFWLIIKFVIEGSEVVATPIEVMGC